MLLPDIEKGANQAFVLLHNDRPLALKSDLTEDALQALLHPDILKHVKKQIKDPFKYQVIPVEKYDICFLTSQKANWSYFYITPNNIIKKEFNKLFVNSLNFYILLIVIGTCFSLFITNKLYKPIQTLLNNMYSYGKSEVTDEVIFITETFDAINKANKTLSKILQKNTAPLKEKFLKDLLSGLIPEQQIREHLDQYDLSWLKNDFSVVVLECINYKENDEIVSKELLSILQLKIVSLFKTEFNYKYQYEIFQWRYKKYILITEQKDTDYLKSMLNTIISSIEAEFEISMIAGIGKPCNSIDDLEKHANNISNVLDNRFIIGKKQVISYQDIEHTENNFYFYTLENERDLISYIVEGKKNQAFSLLNYILKENLEKRHLSKEALSQFIFAIITTINRIMQQLNKTMDDFFNEGTILYIELKMCENHEQLKEKILNIFHEFISYICSKNEEQDNSLANDMIAFVHEKYMTDLSLTDMANQFNLSTSYISKLFKNFTGENFKNYLNIYRIEKAKEILKERSDIKIKDLAEMVGYNNSTSFIRMFKKYEGLSPGNFQKHI